MSRLNKFLAEDETVFDRTEEIISDIKSLMSDILGSDVAYYLTRTHQVKLLAIEHKIQQLEAWAKYGE